MRRLMIAMLCLLGALLPAGSHASDNLDVAPSTRSTVRVVLIQDEGDEQFLLGHGSGFAVAPNRIVTNAHVVKQAVEDSSIRIGVIPSEGTKRYFARVIAYSPTNDLALVEFESGNLPVATLFTGQVPDGADVAAIGYPANVDRALEGSVEDRIAPMRPVQSRGTVSGGRSSHSYDTVLHTANIARGNSGGPLVDTCGRVVGVNSFLAITDGIDSGFSFAASVRELMPFLRNAGVKPLTTDVPCLSLAEQDRLEEKLADEDNRTSAAAQDKIRSEQARRGEILAEMQDEIRDERDNGLATAAVLFVLGAFAVGGAIMLHGQGKTVPSRWTGGLGGLLILGAVFAFFTRPVLADAHDRLERRLGTQGDAAKPVAVAAEGRKVCAIDMQRSRITISSPADVSLTWKKGGCVNGKTQYAEEKPGVWSRIFVPEEEPTVTIMSFEPAKNRYSTERWQLESATMDQARAIRKTFDNKSCTSDGKALASIGEMQGQVRAILPDRSNERLTYSCTKSD